MDKKRSESQNEGEQHQTHRFTPSDFDQDSAYGDGSRENTKNGHGEAHTQHDVQRQTDRLSSELRNNSNPRDDEPKCRDIHEFDGRDVFHHVLRNHDDCRSYRGETDQDGVAGNVQTNLGHSLDSKTGRNEEMRDAEKVIEEEPKHTDDHVRINHDANSHEIVNHAASQRCRRELDRPNANGITKQGVAKRDYPWIAPRVLAQYLAMRMSGGTPIEWTIDDYDGEESWEEEKTQPAAEYGQDIETSANQYHGLANRLYQYEDEMDDLLAEWRADQDNQTYQGESKRICIGVQSVCMEMY